MSTRGLFTSYSPTRLKWLLLGTSCMLVAANAHAGMIPAQPSVEVNLNALEMLRPQAFVPPVAPAVKPGKKGAKQLPVQQPSMRQRPMEQPVAQAPYAPPVAAPVPYVPALAAPAPAPYVAQAPAPAPQSSGSLILPPPLPPLSAQPPVQQPQPIEAYTQLRMVPAQQQQVPLEVVKPIAAPAAPLPKIAAKPAQKNYADLSKPGSATQKTAAVEVPHVPTTTPNEQSMLNSLDMAGKQNPVALPKPSDSYPKLSPLPPMPASAVAVSKAAPSPVDTLVANTQVAPPASAPLPAAPVAPAPATMVVNKPVAVVPPKVEPIVTPPAKDDAMFKNLSDRANSLFVKEPEKQGIVSDKTVVTGQPATMPKKPVDVKPAEAPKIAAVPPMPAAEPVKAAVAIPAPTMPTPMADKLAIGAKNAPTVPVATPPADMRGIMEKPKQLTLEEVNKKSPPETMHVAPPPIPVAPVPVKPVENPTPVVAAPAPVVPAAVVTPAASLPTIATPPAVKPPSQPLASADDIASILPPPSATAKPPVVTNAKPVELPPVVPPVAAPVAAKPAPASNLPALPTLSKAPAEPLPSISAITGDDRSSMDIANDSNGIRTASIEPAKPAADVMPKVTRGEPGSSLPPLPPMTPAPSSTLPSPEKLNEKPKEAPKPAAAVATPDAPASTVVASLPGNQAQPSEPQPASVARAVMVDQGAGDVKMSLPFLKDKSDIDPDTQSKITGLAKDLKKQGSQVRIVTYASGKPEEQSTARRISLSRALQIRAKLIEQGVDPMKITTQALGNTQNADKADIVVK